MPKYTDPADVCLDPSSPSFVRRRRRTNGTTAEERREARAERNRIAAQISRDRRKAQYSTLEARVAELEEENKQLKANMSAKGFCDPDLAILAQRAKENEELKERIRILEKGWEGVIKALAAQVDATANGTGPVPIPPIPPKASSSSPTPSTSSSNPTVVPAETSTPTLAPEDLPPRHPAAGGFDLGILSPSDTSTADPDDDLDDDMDPHSAWLRDVLSPSAEAAFDADFPLHPSATSPEATPLSLDILNPVDCALGLDLAQPWAWGTTSEGLGVF